MAYLSVVKKTKDLLILERSPGRYSAIVTAVIFIALAWIVNQQSSSIGINSIWWWTPVSTTVCFLLSLTSVEKWESCDFSKKCKTVRLTHQSLFRKVFRMVPHSVVINLGDISDVKVEETVLKFVKQKARVVTLTSDEGHNYYLTDSWTTDPLRDHSEICETIMKFLNEEIK